MKKRYILFDVERQYEFLTALLALLTAATSITRFRYSFTVQSSKRRSRWCHGRGQSSLCPHSCPRLWVFAAWCLRSDRCSRQSSFHLMPTMPARQARAPAREQAELALALGLGLGLGPAEPG